MQSSGTLWYLCYHRVQMSDLSSVQTTSFHTRLTFLDDENDETLFEEEEEEEDIDEYGEKYNTYLASDSE